MAPGHEEYDKSCKSSAPSSCSYFDIFLNLNLPFINWLLYLHKYDLPKGLETRGRAGEVPGARSLGVRGDLLGVPGVCGVPRGVLGVPSINHNKYDGITNEK